MMSPRLVLAGFIFVCAIQSSQSPVAAPHEASGPRLQLAVRTDKQTYSITGNMQMEVQLTNVGQEAVYLYRWDLCWGQGPTLNLWVYDAAGREVHTGPLWDCVPPPPKNDDPSEFIRLEPGTFFGIRDETKLREIVIKPGEYDLTIEFGSALDAEFLKEARFPKLPYWTKPERPLTKKIHIAVTH